MGQLRKEAKQEEGRQSAPRLVPQPGRDYVVLIQRSTSVVQRVLLDQWEQMKQGDGEKAWGPTKCASCRQAVVHRCVYVDAKTGWARYIESCGCCSIEGKGEVAAGGAAPPEPEVSTEPPTESAEVET